MKPALKIEVSREAQMCLVTTEDGVFGLLDDAVDNPFGLATLLAEDYTDTKFNYFPPEMMDEVRACGEDWKTVYSMARH